jgi:hypothetical protein
MTDIGNYMNEPAIKLMMIIWQARINNRIDIK